MYVRRLCRFQYWLRDSFKNLTSVYVSSAAFLCFSFSPHEFVLMEKFCLLLSLVHKFLVSFLISMLVIKVYESRKPTSRYSFFINDSFDFRLLLVIAIESAANHCFVEWIRLQQINDFIIEQYFLSAKTSDKW